MESAFYREKRKITIQRTLSSLDSSVVNTALMKSAAGIAPSDSDIVD
jgi:hypothetical protein